VELGWRKPVPDVQDPYVTAILSSVFSASVTSTPSPLPPDVFSSLTTVPLFNGGTKVDLDATTTSTPITTTSTTTPTRGCTVVVPGGPTNSLSGTNTYHHSICSQVTSSIGLGPSPLAPYQVTYNSTVIAKHKKALTEYRAAFVAAAESIVSSSSAASTRHATTTS
jgi:hypothetical protein